VASPLVPGRTTECRGRACPEGYGGSYLVSPLPSLVLLPATVSLLLLLLPATVCETSGGRQISWPTGAGVRASPPLGSCRPSRCCERLTSGGRRTSWWRRQSRTGAAQKRKVRVRGFGGRGRLGGRGLITKFIGPKGVHVGVSMQIGTTSPCSDEI
jgi:hypothetical protein